MRALAWRCALLLLAATAASSARISASSVHQIRGIDGLARAYDFILEARFDQVEAELRRACPPAPTEACEVLGATSLWWQILLDPESRELDDEFSTAVDRAIASTEAWTERAPDDAEAWFYNGGAYAARVQWRVLRNEKLAAARDGKAIKVALERAIELDPTLEDAYFGVGMYKYYADVAPAAAKFLRFLMLLPGGDRKEGLDQMLRARTRGRLLQGEADYQLHVIYLWYERQTPRALQLLQSLHERYPANPLFVAQTAEIQDVYQHDVTASLATWQSLLAAAREQRANLPMRLGEAYDRLGSRASAVDAYRAAIASVPTSDPYKVRSQSNERLRRAPDTRRAEAYRLSLEGWRRLEHNDPAAAAAALETSLGLNGADPVAHYRYGRVQQARKDDAAALAQFEHTIRGAHICPAPILGNAYLEAARVLERLGRRTEAISYYHIATTLFGAAADTRAAATRALTRLER